MKFEYQNFEHFYILCLYFIPMHKNKNHQQTKNKKLQDLGTFTIV